MKKQSKQLMILLVILVFVIVGYFGLQKYYQVQNEKQNEETRTILIDVARDDITAFTFDYEGQTYSLEKKEDIWYYTEDNSIEINQNRILAMLNGVSPLYAEQEIANVTDMAQYGLDNPSKTITIQTETGSYTVEAGAYNSFHSVYYLRFPGENTVYTVKAQSITTFDRDMEDLKVEESTE